MPSKIEFWKDIIVVLKFKSGALPGYYPLSQATHGLLMIVLLVGRLPLPFRVENIFIVFLLIYMVGILFSYLLIHRKFIFFQRRNKIVFFSNIVTRVLLDDTSMLSLFESFKNAVSIIKRVCHLKVSRANIYFDVSWSTKR